MFAFERASLSIVLSSIIFVTSAFPISPGDTVRTTVTTKVMSGTEELTQAAPGTTFQVQQTNNSWLLGRFSVGSKKVLGWVRAGDVEPVAEDVSEDLTERLPERQSLGTAHRFAVSDDNTMLAIETTDQLGSIQIVDLLSADVKWKVSTLSSHTVEAIGFSPSGRLLGARTDDQLHLWRLTSDGPEPLLNQDTSETKFSMFSEIVVGENRVAIVDDGANGPVRIWNADGQLLANYRTSARSPIACLFNEAGTAFVAFYPHKVQYWKENGDPQELSGTQIEEVCTDRQRRIAVIRTPEGVLVWRLDSLQTSDTLKSDKIAAITMSADGQTLLTARTDGGRVEVSRINAEGKLEYANAVEGFSFYKELPSQPLVTIPDGSKVAFGSTYFDRNPSVLLADTRGKAWEALRMIVEKPGKPVAPAESLAVTPDASSLVVKRQSGEIVLYDTKSNHAVWTHHAEDVTHLKLHPTGRTLLLNRDRGECVLCRPLDWAIDAKKLDLRRDGRECELRMLQFSPDGRTLAVLSDRRGSQIATFSAVGEGAEVTASFNANAFQFTSDGGRLFLLGSSGGAHYDLANRSLQPLRDYRFGATFQKGERAMFGWITQNGDRKQALYDPRTGAGFSEINPREASTSGLKTTTLDGTLIAFVGRRLRGQGSAIEVVDVATGATKHAFPLDVDSYTGIRFAPDGRHLLLATSDEIVRIDYRKRQFEVFADASQRADLDSEPTQASEQESRGGGGIASAAVLGAASEVADGTWIKSSGIGRGSGASDADSIRSIDVSSNGWLFTGHRSGSVNIWNGYTGELIRSIKNPPDSVELLAASPDGSKIACAAKENGVAYLLDLHRVLPQQPPTPTNTEQDTSEEPELSLEIK